MTDQDLLAEQIAYYIRDYLADYLPEVFAVLSQLEARYDFFSEVKYDLLDMLDTRVPDLSEIVEVSFED